MKKNIPNSVHLLSIHPLRMVSLLVLLFSTLTIQAATITWNGTTNSNFALASNWTGGMPGAADVIVIPNTAPHMPVISTGNFNVASVTINTGSSAALTIIGGTLTVSGATSFFVSGKLNVNGGQIYAGGNLVIFSGGTVNQSEGIIHLNTNPGSVANANLSINGSGNYNLSGGTINVRDIEIALSASFNQSNNNSKITLSRDYKNQGGIYNAIEGTIEWIGAASSGVKFSGTNQFFNVLIGINVDPNFDDENNNTFYVAGNWTNHSNVVNILNRKITTAIFNGSGNQTIGGTYGTCFRNLTVNKPGGILILAINSTIDKNGTLNINSGTFDLQAFTFNPETANGNGIMAIGAAGKLLLGGSTGGRTGSNFPDLFTHNNFASGSTVEYNGNQTQTIFGVSYSNLVLTNSAGTGTATKITTTDITVGNQILVNSGVVLTPAADKKILGSGMLTGTGTVQVTRMEAPADMVTQYPMGTYQLLDMTVDYFATAAQSVNALNYGNLTVSGSRTSSSVTFSLTGTVGVARTFSPIATFTSGSHIVTNSTINFNGLRDQVIPAFTFNNMTCSGGFTKTAIGQPVVNNTLTTATSTTLDMSTYPMSGALLTITNMGWIRTANTSIAPLSPGRNWTGTVEYYSPSGGQTAVPGTFSTLMINNESNGTTASGNLIINSNLFMASGTLTTGANTLNLKGNVTRTSGIVNATGSIVTCDGTSAQTIAAGALTGTLVHYTINNASGVTSNNSVAVTGTVALTAGTLNIGTSTLTISGILSRTSGIMNASSGVVVFNNNIAQNIPVMSFTGNIGGLTVDNAAGVTVNENYTVSNALQMTSGRLNINGTTFTIGGTVSGPGELRGSQSSSVVVASNGVVGTLNFDQTTDETTNALSNFSVSEGNVSLGNKLNLFTVLNISGGNFNMDGKNVVLKSLPTNTARIAPVTGGISNYTNVTVERYVPDNERRYRLLSPGVTTTGSIRDNWMESAMNTDFWGPNANQNPKPGYGTHISGNGMNSNGFDVTQTTQNSVFLLNHLTGLWTPLANTNAPLEADKGYLIFIRGDRSVDMTLTGEPITLPGTATTLRATGTINIGSKNLTSLLGNGGNSLIANPYASPVSWNKISANNSSNFENFYTYWDPKVGERGSYITFTNMGLRSHQSSNATEEIQGGQAFFIKSKVGVSSPNFMLSENDKSTTANINVFRTDQLIEQLFTSLYFYSGTKRINADGVLTAYGNIFSNKIDQNDAVQIPNWDEDIFIKRNGKNLSIETRSPINGNDTIFLSIVRLKRKNYEWQFDPEKISFAGKEAFLFDKFSGMQTSISLDKQTIIPFEITSNPASADENRFMIVLKPVATLISEPVLYTSINAFKFGKGAKINWLTGKEIGINNFETERSTDGTSFKQIASVKAKGSNANEYNVFDNAPVPGINYYRIKAVANGGSVKYSEVKAVSFVETAFQFDVFPNPIQGENINIQLLNGPEGRYTLSLVNSVGQQVKNITFDYKGSGNYFTLPLSQPLVKGIYHLNLTGGSGLEKSIKIISN